jgi:hypothetical protein
MEEGEQMNIVAQSISDGIKLPSMANVSECAERKQLLGQLVAGLLASGHYTNPDQGFDTPSLRKYDAGESWKEDGYPSRRHAHVIDDAESLLKAIEYIVKQEDVK